MKFIQSTKRRIACYFLAVIATIATLTTLSPTVVHSADNATQTESKVDSKTRKLSAIQTMADLLKTKNPPKFFVVLLAYKIEGKKYRASGLTVSEHHTHNFSRTPEGFECDALFSPDMIDEQTKKGARIEPNSLVKVRLSANHEDILMIVMFKEDGSQSILYD